MKKVLKVILVLLAIVIVGSALSGGGSSKQSGSKDSSNGDSSKPKWNTNFEDPQAIAQNMDLSIKLMKKMDHVAANAKKVSPADVLNNPERYMGKVIEFGVKVTEIYDPPPDNNTSKVFGGTVHVVGATTDDGVTVIYIEKGDAASSNRKVGEFTVIFGMPIVAGDLPNVGKGLLIAGDPN